MGNLSLLGGISYIQGDTRIDHSGGEAPYAAYGTTRIYGLDLTAKYFIDSHRYLSWQSEYFYRHQDLTVGSDPNPGNSAQAFDIFAKEKNQSGLYSQLVYKFAPRWKMGIRYDLLNLNDINVGGNQQPQPGGLDRYSAMLQFMPSEFSSFRLQLNRNNALFTGGRATGTGQRDFPPIHHGHRGPRRPQLLGKGVPNENKKISAGRAVAGRPDLPGKGRG